MLNSTESGTEVIAIIGTVIYAGGFLGNLLSLTIFIPLRIRRVSTGLLFLCLTISNNIHLITLFVEFLDTAYQIRLFHPVFIRCRMIYWLQNIFRALSSFIACTISLDRMFRAVYPTRAKDICTHRHAQTVSLVYFLTFTLSFTFYLLPYINEDEHGICSTRFNRHYDQFITRFWPPFRTVIICFLPVSIMILANIRLWRQIRASKRRVAPRLSIASHSSSADHMLAFLMVANVVSFISTQVPFHLYTSIVGYHVLTIDIRTPMLLWSSLYFGIGFYIYCLTSPYFRSKFLTSICWHKHREPRNFARRNTISHRFPFAHSEAVIEDDRIDEQMKTHKNKSSV